VQKFWYFFLLFFALNSEAQHRFSQTYSSPLLLNPANTGLFEGQYRLGGQFRKEINTNNQLNSIKSLFTDFKILKSLTAENDHFGMGFMALHENSLQGGIKTDQFSMSLGYQKGLDDEGNQQLSIGFQTSYINEVATPPNYIIETDLIKWVQAGFSSLNMSGGTLFQVQFFDLNVGLVYKGKINDDNLFSVGLSVAHANKPSKTFQGGEFNLSRQPFTNITWERSLPNNNKIYSGAYGGFTKGTMEDGLLGCMYQMNIADSKNQFLFGSWFRKSKLKGSAIVPTLGLKFSKLNLTCSYDISISREVTSQRGAAEISLIYIK
jgi:type IX secretion system PorP/SprF family membrane protein